MGRYRIIPKVDTTSVTEQNFRTLQEVLDMFIQTGVLDLPSTEGSYDFDSSEDVDFDRPVPHDVDLYDAACGQDDPYLNVPKLKDNKPGVAADSSSDEATPPPPPVTD